MRVDPASSALVVVDMQHGFCHPDGSLYAPGSEAAIEPVNRAIERARMADIPVVFTRDVHPEAQFEETYYYDEFDRWGEHALEGSWDAELHEDLEIADGDVVIDKHTYDAFYQTRLEGYLESHHIRDLLFAGTLANVCVLHTAGSAGLRDYRPIVLEEAIGAIEPGHKEYALDHAEWLFGEVVSLEELQLPV